MSATVPAKKRQLRTLQTPLRGNKVYGDDVPMFWKDAANESGIAERTFWRLIENREIAHVIIAGRVKVRPSVMREYVGRGERAAI